MLEELRASLDNVKPCDRTGGAHTFLLHKRLLGERLYFYSLARFGVVSGMIVVSLAAKYVVGIEGLDVPRLIGVAGVLAFYNVIIFLMVRPYRDRRKAENSYILLSGIMHGAIMLDFLFLTICLWLVGGAKSPFQAFYVFNVILASVLLSRPAAFGHTFVGFLFLAGLIVGEWLKIIPPTYPEGAIGWGEELDARFVVTLLFVYGALFTLSTLMLTSLMQLLRSGEREIRLANAELERLSGMRRDFLHLALHNMRAPANAVAMHIANLQAQLAGRLSQEQERWLCRCRLRLQEQSDFLADLQVLAFLESSGIEKEATDVDVKAMLQGVVAEHQDVARMREQALALELPSGVLPPVHGIERLLREAVVNLVTNALKYTPRRGAIVVRALPTPGGVRIEVQDDGSGIAPADQERLFEEFARIPKNADADIDDQVSSGLGLSIVRRIVETHGGKVSVTSELQKGSTFAIDLPA
ncbi:MAG: hypothetical protein GWP08_07810 [Nitrospiraceae bacterium]|nr:hypothetical protein [Nitrospiraceae bacterium]